MDGRERQDIAFEYIYFVLHNGYFSPSCYIFHSIFQSNTVQFVHHSASSEKLQAGRRYTRLRAADNLALPTKSAPLAYLH